MKEKQVKAQLEAIRNFTKKQAKNKEMALAFLVKAGILTPAGQLTRKYAKS